MEGDLAIRRRVEEELEADPSVTAEGIGVVVQNGVVTLSGHVPAYSQRFTATRCAQRVRGVKAVALDLVVRLPNLKKHADDEIAGRAVAILGWTLQDVGEIKVSVEGGWVTLAGTVDWAFQKRDAERAIRLLGGVTGVTNTITVRPRIDPRTIRQKIHCALRRAADREGANIGIAVEGTAVTLTGAVASWHERRAAEEAVLMVPGVDEVHDLLTVD